LRKLVWGLLWWPYFTGLQFSGFSDLYQNRNCSGKMCIAEWLKKVIICHVWIKKFFFADGSAAVLRCPAHLFPFTPASLIQVLE
jgi:hypothetical protein